MRYRYYSTQRPIDLGTYPRHGKVQIFNFNERIYCEAIGREAWGYLDYDHRLNETEAKQYELVYGGEV